VSLSFHPLAREGLPKVRHSKVSVAPTNEEPMINDAQKVALLESTLREILRLDEEAGRGNKPGSMPFRYALSGDLRLRWIDIRVKAQQLLDGTVR
jgi:hypothetical protein